MIYLKLFILVVFYTLDKSESARILAIIPTASFSHQIFYRPFWKELANRGHEVVLMTTDPINDPSIKNLKEIDLSAAYSRWNASIMNMVKTNEDKLETINVMVDAMFDIAEIEYSNPEVKALYNSKDEHFDLLIIEYLMPTMFIFKHKFKDTPFIGVSSLDVPLFAHMIVGNPVHNILYPNYLLALGDNLTFFQRLYATLFDAYMIYWSFTNFNPRMSKLVQKHFGEDITDVWDMGYNVDMLFANTNPMFNPTRPFTPATISIAGLHDVPLKPLPKDLKDFLDNSKEGVIYFSLGSNVKSKEIPEETRKIIMETFAQLPYKVLWKFEDEKLPGKPKNVNIMKWLPQLDLLRHKNLLVFVTQGGLQSLEESLYARVPVVVMPFFADQESNARHASTKGLGVTIDHKTLTVEGFKSALLEVITNDKYRKRVKEMADLIQDQPMKPLDRAVWWTEYVLRHKGAKHLHGPSIPFYQFIYLDVIAFISVIGLFIFGVVYYICKKVLCLVCRVGCCKSSSTKGKDKKQKTN